MDKLLRDIKFLEEVKRASLNNKDVPIPYSRPELYMTQMFVLGLNDVLKSRGFKIVKEEK